MIAVSDYITLDDVCMELYGRHIQSGDNQNQCIADADSLGGTWDPNYVGDKNSLMNFKGFELKFLSADNLIFDINGGTQYVTVRAKERVYIESAYGLCSVSPASEYGVFTLEITCPYNYDGIDKNDTIYLRNASDTVIGQITITQTYY